MSNANPILRMLVALRVRWPVFEYLPILDWSHLGGSKLGHPLVSECQSFTLNFTYCNRKAVKHMKKLWKYISFGKDIGSNLNSPVAYSTACRRRNTSMNTSYSTWFLKGSGVVVDAIVQFVFMIVVYRTGTRSTYSDRTDCMPRCKSTRFNKTQHRYALLRETRPQSRVRL